jgi:DNA-directed RNA polymerase subunit M/transcription elongation factor TFIIS
MVFDGVEQNPQSVMPTRGGNAMSDALQCPKCGAPYDETAKECSTCGISFALYAAPKPPPVEESAPEPEGAQASESESEGEDPRSKFQCPNCGHESVWLDSCPKCEIFYIKYFDIQEKLLKDTGQNEDDLKGLLKQKDLLLSLQKAKEEEERAEAERKEQEERQKLEELKKQKEEREKAEAKRREKEEKERAKQEAIRKKQAEEEHVKQEALRKKQAEEERIRQEALDKQKAEEEEIARQEAVKRQKEEEKRAKQEEKERAKQEAIRKKQEEEERAKQEALRKKQEEEEHAKQEALRLQKEREEADRKTVKILKSRSTLKDLLKKYEGQQIAIDYVTPGELNSARLMFVNNDYFTLMSDEEGWLYSIPIRQVFTTIETVDQLIHNHVPSADEFGLTVRLIHPRST